MNNCELSVSVDSLRLKVKFPSKITITIKYKTQEFVIIDQVPLGTGPLSAPAKKIVLSEVPQNKQKWGEQQKIVGSVYLHSTQGRLAIGSFTPKLKDLLANPTFVQKLKNAPDKTAQLTMTIKIALNQAKKPQSPKTVPVKTEPARAESPKAEPVKKELFRGDSIEKQKPKEQNSHQGNPFATLMRSLSNKQEPPKEQKKEKSQQKQKQDLAVGFLATTNKSVQHIQEQKKQVELGRQIKNKRLAALFENASEAKTQYAQKQLPIHAKQSKMVDSPAIVVTSQKKTVLSPRTKDPPSSKATPLASNIMSTQKKTPLSPKAQKSPLIPRMTSIQKNPMLRTAGSPIQRGGRGNVQTLMTKLGEARRISQKQMRLSEQLAQMERQLKIQRQRANNLQLQLRQKEYALSTLQKQLALRVQRGEGMQSQMRQRYKRGSTLQQKVRELQYRLKHLTAQNSQLTHNNNLLLRRGQKKDEFYKEQMAQLNQKCQNLQKQKEQLEYKLDSNSSTLQQAVKKAQLQMKQKVKTSTDQKNIRDKKISQLQRTVGQLKDEKTTLIQKNKALTQQVKQLQKSTKQLRQQQRNLKDRIADLQLSLNTSKMQKQVVEQQLRQQKQKNQVNNQLASKIVLSQQRNAELQMQIQKQKQQMLQLQQTLKQKMQQIQSLQTQFQKLYYENVQQVEQAQKRKNIISSLTLQVQQLQKAMEKMNLVLANTRKELEEYRNKTKSQAGELGRILQEKEEALKVATEELAQQQQRRQTVEGKLDENSKKLIAKLAQCEELQGRVPQLQGQLHVARGQIVLNQNKITYLTQQLQQMKKAKEDRESRLGKIAQQGEMAIKNKDQQIHQLQSKSMQLRSQLVQMQHQMQRNGEVVASKVKQINDLKNQIEMKRKQQGIYINARRQLQLTISQYKDKVIDMHQQIDNLREEQKKYMDHLEDIDKVMERTQSTFQSRVEAIREMLKEKKELEEDIYIAKEKNDNLSKDFDQLKKKGTELETKLSAKETQLQGMRKQKQQLQRYMDATYGEMNNKIKQKQAAAVVMSLFKLGTQNKMKQDQTKIQSFGDKMKNLNEKIQSIVQENQQLNAKIASMREDQERMGRQLQSAADREADFQFQKKEFKEKIKEKEGIVGKGETQTQALKDEIRKLKQEIAQLTAQLQTRRQLVRQHEHTIQQLRDQVQRLDADMGKQRLIWSAKQQQWSIRDKDIKKSIQLIQQQNQNKLSKLTQQDNQKKNRLGQLNHALDNLRKQNYDLQTVAYAQKTNNTKLNNIQQEITNSIDKLQKNNPSIKSYYLIPIKDLLKKFQGIMSASDKMYQEFDKKNAKREK